MKPTDDPVVVTQKFAESLDRVWQAITQRDQMQEWFFSEIESFEPITGFETRFNVVCENKNYLRVWKLLDVVPGEKIVYDWRYDGLPGAGKVTWELQESDSGTQLTLTNEIVETFPEDDPNFKRESCEAGWGYFINEQLPDFLSSN